MNQFAGLPRNLQLRGPVGFGKPVSAIKPNSLYASVSFVVLESASKGR